MYDVIAGDPVFEGYAADLPEVEPTEADLAAIELVAAWDVVQERLVAVDVQRARFGQADEVAERRFRRSVTAALRRRLAVESGEAVEGAIA